MVPSADGFRCAGGPYTPGKRGASLLCSFPREGQAGTIIGRAISPGQGGEAPRPAGRRWLILWNDPRRPDRRPGSLQNHTAEQCCSSPCSHLGA